MKKAEINKYLHKRKQIISIIESISIDYETDECVHNVTPGFWESRTAAEKILSKMGINKPKYVSDIESPGYSISCI